MSRALVVIALLISLAWACETEPYKQGRLIYEVNCGNCHMADGKGMGAMYPDITQSDYMSALRDELPCLMRHGRDGGVLSNVVMPANDLLTPVAMTNLINYISYKWGDGTITNLQEVRDQLSDCSKYQ